MIWGLAAYLSISRHKLGVGNFWLSPLSNDKADTVRMRAQSPNHHDYQKHSYLQHERVSAFRAWFRCDKNVWRPSVNLSSLTLATA